MYWNPALLPVAEPGKHHQKHAELKGKDDQAKAENTAVPPNEGQVFPRRCLVAGSFRGGIHEFITRPSPPAAIAPAAAVDSGNPSSALASCCLARERSSNDAEEWDHVDVKHAGDRV